MLWWTLRLWFLLKCVYFFRLFLSFFRLFYLFLSFSASFCPFFLFPVLFYPFSVLFCLSLSFFILSYPYSALLTLPCLLLSFYILSTFFYSFQPYCLLYSVLFRFLLFPNHLFLFLISYPFIYSLYSLLYFHSVYSLPLFLLPLHYLPDLQCTKCICITSPVLSGFVFPLLTSIYSYSCLCVPVVVI